MEYIEDENLDAVFVFVGLILRTLSPSGLKFEWCYPQKLVFYEVSPTPKNNVSSSEYIRESMNVQLCGEACSDARRVFTVSFPPQGSALLARDVHIPTRQ